MYPNLTPILVVLLAVASGVAIFISIRRPFLRKLAVRQATRRRNEAALVIAGSILGTAIIIGSLIVGDTLNFSVKRSAYTGLGPIDEIVASPSMSQGNLAASQLEALRHDPEVDGLLTVRADQTSVTSGFGSRLEAEPRATVWEVDFRQAAAFGGSTDGGSGLSGPGPALGAVIINRDLATALNARSGDLLTFFLYGRPQPLRVTRILPTMGMAGAGGGTVTRNAFVTPGTLEAAVSATGWTRQPQTLTFVSNAGGVEAGNQFTDSVSAKIHQLLGPLSTAGTSVETPKHDVLKSAKEAGDGLGSMFLFIGSFSIIAGVLLLVNIFVMLAEERKPELGMLRAIGMKRSRLVRTFMIEGSLYALIASLLGVGFGIGVGRAVVLVAARIFSSTDENAFTMVFKFTWTSIINGFAMGFLISFVAVTLTSMRISRINIVAAIRDLSTEGAGNLKRRWVVLSSLGAALFGAASVSAISQNQGAGSYLFPALTVLALCPLAVRLVSKRVVYNVASLLVLAWSLMAGSVRPGILDSDSMAVYVVMGVLLTFSAVFLVSENQRLITSPLRPLIDRPSESGLATRLAVAYPTARRFRTGAILSMYGLVVFTLVIIMVLGSMIDATVNSTVANAAGGFPIRADFNVSNPVGSPVGAFTHGRFTGRVRAVVPLVASAARVTGLASFSDRIDVIAVGAGRGIVDDGLYPLESHLSRTPDDRAAWNLVMANPSYVIVDQFMGQEGGGPPGSSFAPGDTFTLTDPATGRAESKTIAGILKAADGLRGIQNSGFTSPVLMSADAATAQFGSMARLASALIKPAPGVAVGTLAGDLQAEYLSHGLVSVQVRQEVERSMTATRGFFQLMQGFLALGLLVGIAGLGIVMVRAVRERRRTIGILRALGFGGRTIRRAFLGESSFVAVEGILVGAGLAVVTSYLLFKNSSSFQDTGVGFPVPWLALGMVLGLTAVASILATFWPARKASQVRPAVALRIAD